MDILHKIQIIILLKREVKYMNVQGHVVMVIVLSLVLSESIPLNGWCLLLGHKPYPHVDSLPVPVDT